MTTPQNAPHTDTGWRCLVAHYDAKGRLQPPCVKCSCGEWVKDAEWSSHRNIGRSAEEIAREEGP